MFTQDPISDIRLKNPPLISSAVFADIYSRCSALSLAAKASCFWNPLVVWLPLQGQNNNDPLISSFVPLPAYLLIRHGATEQRHHIPASDGPCDGASVAHTTAQLL